MLVLLESFKESDKEAKSFSSCKLVKGLEINVSNRLELQS